MKHSVNEPATVPRTMILFRLICPGPWTMSQLRLDSACAGRWVLFIYPLTGKPDGTCPGDGNPRPARLWPIGVRFRDHSEELSFQGIGRVSGLSSDRHECQVALVRRFRLPCQTLSDPKFGLETEMDLPTFEAFGQRLYKRLTMVLTADTIEHVFYPVFPPDTHAAEVLYWLRQNSAGTGA